MDLRDRCEWRWVAVHICLYSLWPTLLTYCQLCWVFSCQYILCITAELRGISSWCPCLFRPTVWERRVERLTVNTIRWWGRPWSLGYPRTPTTAISICFRQPTLVLPEDPILGVLLFIEFHGLLQFVNSCLKLDLNQIGRWIIYSV